MGAQLFVRIFRIFLAKVFKVFGKKSMTHVFRNVLRSDRMLRMSEFSVILRLPK